MQHESSNAYRHSESGEIFSRYDRELIKSDTERCYSLTRDNNQDDDYCSERSLSEQHDLREDDSKPLKAVSPEMHRPKEALKTVPIAV